jgi:hypothetical protein
MMARQLIWISFLFLMINSATSQAPVDPAIKAKLDTFIEYSNTGQWEKAFDLIYPKLFTRVPKQDMVDLMQRTQVGMSIKMENTKILTASSPVQEGNETFVRLSYSSDLTVAIEKGGIYDSPKSLQAISDQLKSTYGGRSVEWNEEKKQYHIRATKNMMAINPGDGDWKLVEINMEQPELMEFLFSPTIMDELVRVE